VEVMKSPVRMDELFEGLFHEEAVVRARAADALEKISVQKPEWLRPYRGRLLREVAQIDQKEVRWHLAQMLGRVPLTAKQTAQAIKLLSNFLHSSDSQIVKVSSMQALADLALQDQSIRPKVSRLLKAALKSGSPSIKARARKILTRDGIQ